MSQPLNLMHNFIIIIAHDQLRVNLNMIHLLFYNGEFDLSIIIMMNFLTKYIIDIVIYFPDWMRLHNWNGIFLFRFSSHTCFE